MNKMTKNEALLKIAEMLMDQRLKPQLDKMIKYKLDNPKPITYNPSLDEIDYMEWKAKQENKLIHMGGKSCK